MHRHKTRQILAWSIRCTCIGSTMLRHSLLASWGAWLVHTINPRYFEESARNCCTPCCISYSLPYPCGLLVGQLVLSALPWIPPAWLTVPLTCAALADTNECAADNGNCDHLCVNIPGSYSCSCHSGYYLSSNRHHCHGTALLMCQCLHVALQHV